MKNQQLTRIVYNLLEITNLYNNWKSCLPKIKPYYAIKCNPDIGIISHLSKLGCNFDCASQNEISLVRSVSANDIIFANPCKFETEIDFAINNNVKLTTLDNINEIPKIENKNIDCLLRIYSRDITAVCNLDKYGALEIEWDEILRECKNKKINLKGISFHIGSNARNPEVFKQTIINAARCFKLARIYDYNMNILDIGGGFNVLTLKDCAEVINETIDENFDTNIELIAEPGRYFIETCTDLYTTIIGKRFRDGIMNYWISDGIYGSFNCKLYDHKICNPTIDDEMAEKIQCIIYGPTCDGLDVITEKIIYINKNIGDEIKWTNMGAYTFSGACDFNGINHTKHHVEYLDNL